MRWLFPTGHYIFIGRLPIVRWWAWIPIQIGRSIHESNKWKKVWSWIQADQIDRQTDSWVFTTYFGVYLPSWPRPDFFTVILPLVPNFWLVACMIFSFVFVLTSLSPPNCWLFLRLFVLLLFVSIVHTFMAVKCGLKPIGVNVHMCANA